MIAKNETETNELTKDIPNEEYLEMLDKSMDEAETGRVIAKTITELESYEQ